jgi:D-3-phosphoglycerate dehydrogenase
MAKEVAIIGDYFMLPEVFEDKVREACGDEVSVRTRKDNWPDEPMAHGYADPGMEGLKEYFGSAEGVIDFVGGAEILVTHLAPISRRVLERLPGLKMIAVSRGGPVNIDMKAAREFNVLVVNTPGRNSSAVAEFTIGAILAETRKIRTGHEALRVGTWRGDLYRADVTGRELNEMTVGVIGYGNIGTKVVKLLRAFGARILVHDPYVQLSADDIAAGVTLVDFDAILSQSDVVTMHARVTAETTHMMNAQAFAAMKPGSLFVNTARGPLCDYDALYAALIDGPLGSAMLETFGVEPVPADWPLLQLPNVTLTPHIAGASVRTVTFAAEQAAEEVRRYLAGEGARNPC